MAAIDGYSITVEAAVCAVKSIFGLDTTVDGSDHRAQLEANGRKTVRCGLLERRVEELNFKQEAAVRVGRVERADQLGVAIARRCDNGTRGSVGIELRWRRVWPAWEGDVVLQGVLMKWKTPQRNGRRWIRDINDGLIVIVGVWMSAL
jgi:hypothetical protein